MALTGKIDKKTEGNKEIPEFFAKFTNGTLEQLKELATFLEGEGFDLPKNEEEKLIEVIKVSIGWLESVKENKAKQ